MLSVAVVVVFFLMLLAPCVIAVVGGRREAQEERDPAADLPSPVAEIVARQTDVDVLPTAPVSRSEEGQVAVGAKPGVPLEKSSVPAVNVPVRSVSAARDVVAARGVVPAGMPGSSARQQVEWAEVQVAEAHALLMQAQATMARAKADLAAEQAVLAGRAAQAAIQDAVESRRHLRDEQEAQMPLLEDEPARNVAEDGSAGLVDGEIRVVRRAA